MPKYFEKLERIPMFVSELSKIKRKDTDAIWSRCMAELRHLKTGLWLPRGAVEPRRGYKLTTLRGVLRDYRAAIKAQLGVTHPALRYLRPSNDDQRTYQGTYHRTIKNEHQNLRPIVAESLVAIAIEILEQMDKLKRGLVIDAFELLTGRRGWEIACVGDFARPRRKPEALKKAGKHVLLFSGQSKTKNSPNAKIKPYHIPVLADPELLLTSFERLHRLHPQLRRISSNRAYNRNDGKRADELSRKVFFDASMPHPQSLMAKDLRECYAVISYAWYCPSSISLNAWVSNTLGHVADDITTANAYVGFYLLGQKTEFRQAFRQSARETIARLERKKRRAGSDERLQQLEGKIALFKAIIRKD